MLCLLKGIVDIDTASFVGSSTFLFWKIHTQCLGAGGGPGGGAEPAREHAGHGSSAPLACQERGNGNALALFYSSAI